MKYYTCVTLCVVSYFRFVNFAVLFQHGQQDVRKLCKVPADIVQKITVTQQKIV